MASVPLKVCLAGHRPRDSVHVFATLSAIYGALIQGSPRHGSCCPSFADPACSVGRCLRDSSHVAFVCLLFRPNALCITLHAVHLFLKLSSSLVQILSCPCLLVFHPNRVFESRVISPCRRVVAIRLLCRWPV